ncbi:MAG: methylenetetrahydrofolate reductase [NAD(P)H] [Planctomycetales bacterium]|nr:methylenetetrahydrofolate reductase [NAD(P)H] [Planctomycetales bacterium]NIM09268.1 methylenetetrahydrofolate reductase [NAD(P)H] [Planctomycetales bacterium]NIN08736.1 methylenetetrahydrofolate reductase [NAD(P)H] [Planctomycetales bacterium]NIN77855.1 methylenetetrahydrofolate reductase [NAD(P)H] [Planctomycetales bacterium]NIO35038.1 methylenetetrahydrofolate reductase [NAD(P)H] [Planctomycetales bacterium]
MRIGEAYGSGKFGLSFELFPPKTPAGETALFGHVDQLVKFQPSFITCTYGAGGSTREKTLEIVQRVRQAYGCPVASHLTCVGATADQLRDFLREAERRGVDNIVALRGDPPRGESEFRPVAGGLRYANELVTLIRREFPGFGIAVAGYPETHQEAPDPQTDLKNLKRKVEAGGDAVITQLFYNNRDFFRFRDACHDLGITVPIVPGILPVTNFAQVQRITSLCGASLPDDFVAALQACGEDPQRQFAVGVECASRQVQELREAGVPGIHFYVLNKSQATVAVLANLGL